MHMIVLILFQNQISLYNEFVTNDGIMETEK